MIINVFVWRTSASADPPKETEESWRSFPVLMLRMVVTLPLYQSVKRHGEVLPMPAKRLVIWLWLYAVIGLGSTLF